MNDYRCRVSEEELAHDHEQVEITPEMERMAIYDYLEAIHCEIQEVQKTADIPEQQLLQLYALIENARELIL